MGLDGGKSQMPNFPCKVRLGLTFHWQKLWIVPGTWYFFWYHLGRGAKRAEPILKGDSKSLQTTDRSESLLVSRIILKLCKIKQSMMTALWSPDERAR